MGNFYLIQRGSFKDLKKKDYTALTGRNGLIDLDYTCILYPNHA